MEHFYLVLPSNSPNIYFENTSANFKVKLPKTLKLSGEWLVGLAEFSYTYRWYNLETDENIMAKYFENGHLKLIEGRIPQGYYEINQLIATINRVLKIICDKIEAPEFDVVKRKLDKRVYVDFGQYKNTLVYPELSHKLCYMLGFNKRILDDLGNNQLLSYVIQAELDLRNLGIKKELWESTTTIPEEIISYTAPDTYDISGGIHTLLMYCDIVVPHLVGDSKTQLIRNIEIPNRLSYGDQVHLKFDEIFYHKLITKEFESIEIDLKDDSGKNIPFSHASNIVVLHFKKKLYKGLNK